MTISFPIITTTQTAEQTPFDGASLGIEATNLQDAVYYIVSSGSSGLNFEYHTVTAAEVAAKQFSLLKDPAGSQVCIDIIEGTSQQPAIDYAISGRIVSWDGLALDGVIEEGDIVRCIYGAQGLGIEYITITTAMLADGHVHVEKEVVNAASFVLDIIGGCQQYPDVDFSLEGKKIVWKNHPMEELLDEGDVLRVIYQSTN